MTWTALAVLFLSSSIGCDLLSSSDYEEQVVVSAVLQVGEPLPVVRLTRTVPLGDVTDLSTIEVTDADIRISLLDASGEIEEEISYTYQGRGRYMPTGDAPIVLPARSYRFRALVPDRDPITAETTTPVGIELVAAPEESVAYLSNLGPEIQISSSSTEDRQAVYLIQIAALAPDEFEVFQREDETYGVRRAFLPGLFGPTPDASSFIESIDCEPEGDDFECDFDPLDLSSGNSPLLNEQTYIENADGTITVRVPWIGVSFFGPHRFTLNSLDDALVDFVATQSIQFNPTTLSPGEIPNITSNVSNGLGVFGSFSALAVETTIVEGTP